MRFPRPVVLVLAILVLGVTLPSLAVTIWFLIYLYGVTTALVVLGLVVLVVVCALLGVLALHRRTGRRAVRRER